MSDPFQAREPSTHLPPPVRPKSDYEFSGSQELVIGSLSRLMHFVGGATIAFGLLSLLGMLNARGVGGLVILFQAAAMILVGSLTFVIGSRFGKIPESVGADIAHLMNALAGMRTLYLIQAWAIGVMMVLLGLLVALLILR